MLPNRPFAPTSRDTFEWVRKQNIWRYRSRLDATPDGEDSALLRQLLAEERTRRPPGEAQTQAGEDGLDPPPAAGAARRDGGARRGLAAWFAPFRNGR
jgi:hypothetical protein